MKKMAYLFSAVMMMMFLASGFAIAEDIISNLKNIPASYVNRVKTPACIPLP